MNVKQFLLIGGVVLVLLGVVGFIEGDRKILGDFFWFDNAENIAHTLLGIVALAAVFVVPAHLQRPLVLVVGVTGIFFAVLGLLVSGSGGPTNLGPANLENPADNLLHLVVGLWALAVVFLGGRPAQA